MGMVSLLGTCPLSDGSKVQQCACLLGVVVVSWSGFEVTNMYNGI